MKKSTLFALVSFIVALYLSIAVLQNYGPLYALPLGVLVFFAAVFFSCVCDYNEQKK